DASPRFAFPADYSDSAWQVSDEFRVSGEGERHRWSIGAFFLREKLDAFNLFPGTFQIRVDQAFDQTLWTLSPYAYGRYELTDELSLDTGIRYNYEHKNFFVHTESRGLQSGLITTNIDQEESGTWKGVTGEATLSYAPYWDFLDQIQNDKLRF